MSLTHYLQRRVAILPECHLYKRGERFARVDGITRMGNLILQCERSGQRAVIHPSVVQLAPSTVQPPPPPVPKVDPESLGAAVWAGIEDCSSCCLDNHEEKMRVLESILRECALRGLL